MMELFILVSGTVSIVAVVPLGYLALRSVLEARSYGASSMSSPR